MILGDFGRGPQVQFFEFQFLTWPSTQFRALGIIIELHMFGVALEFFGTASKSSNDYLSEYIIQKLGYGGCFRT